MEKGKTIDELKQMENESNTFIYNHLMSNFELALNGILITDQEQNLITSLCLGLKVKNIDIRSIYELIFDVKDQTRYKLSYKKYNDFYKETAHEFKYKRLSVEGFLELKESYEQEKES